ncbi:Hypothetical predicted protein [Mytilus galloprovincialis]|uniref:Uncharacterized protein n=1 Tax=Mytilus galloprovincialis TaxID=29158 RepID=A0A8B6E8E7_MYTGA|nr:Hypothetical predicted protein [Mytilus galloprovincialis]
MLLAYISASSHIQLPETMLLAYVSDNSHIQPSGDNAVGLLSKATQKRRVAWSVRDKNSRRRKKGKSSGAKPSRCMDEVELARKKDQWAELWRMEPFRIHSCLGLFTITSFPFKLTPVG